MCVRGRERERNVRQTTIDNVCRVTDGLEKEREAGYVLMLREQVL